MDGLIGKILGCIGLTILIPCFIGLLMLGLWTVKTVLFSLF
ncbi:hypothetical protein SEA_WIPEOUT_267 [Streptomyces phage Wipeout]|nr:hypothetical protein SEA_WIPEOUT_267 [Streptomyces phage Wipeout]